MIPGPSRVRFPGRGPRTVHQAQRSTATAVLTPSPVHGESTSGATRYASAVLPALAVPQVKSIALFQAALATQHETQSADQKLASPVGA